MRLFHQPGSRSSRVLWTLEELGAPYELTFLDRAAKQTDAHRARHPLGRVPVVELDSGQLVFESAAICLTLADLHPAAGLLPPLGTDERALAYQWTVFAVSELEPSLFGLARARHAGTDDAALAERFTAVAAALRDALAERTWLLGDAFTVPDVLIATMLGTGVRRGVLEDGDPLAAYVQRATARPACRRADAITAPQQPA
jgi:glutathione S-transferase